MSTSSKKIKQDSLSAAQGDDSLCLVSYDKDTGKGLVLDTETGCSKEYSIQNLISAQKRRSSPKRIHTKTPEYKVKEALDRLASKGRSLSFSDVQEEGRDILLVLFDADSGTTYTGKLSYVQKCLRINPNYVFGATPKQAHAKAVATHLDRYGVSFPSQRKETKDKTKATCISRYGVPHYSLTSEFKERFKATSLSRFGTPHPMQNHDLKKSCVEASVSKYGVYHTYHPDVVKKREATLLDRYGVTHPSLNPRIREAMTANSIQTKLDNGVIPLYEGKTVREIAEDTGNSCHYTNYLIQKHGYTQALELLSAYRGSSLTSYLLTLFSGLTPVIDKMCPGTNIRPDLRFEGQKVIVEADGLYWHSDASRGRGTRDVGHPKFHQKRLHTYEEQGYRALFFREDEIYGKPDVVRSIVTNSLHENNSTIFARKCSIVPIGPEFFTKYHLMGKGSGRCYGLSYRGDIVAGIQVRWVKKSEKLLDVSRFATVPLTSVLGGWSRLISHVVRTECPSTLQTFIDRRYGTGNHLLSQGWVPVTDSPSFRWTDGSSSFHRMKFTGSTGYDHGFYKIWDCGQAKWTKEVV